MEYIIDCRFCQERRCCSKYICKYDMIEHPEEQFKRDQEKWCERLGYSKELTKRLCPWLR